MTRLTDKERIDYIDNLNHAAGVLMSFAHEIRQAEKVIRVGPGEIAASLLVHPVGPEQTSDSEKERGVAFYTRCQHRIPQYRVQVRQLRCLTSGEVFVV